MVIASIEPVIIGVALLLLLPCAILLLFAGGFFCRNQWRLDAADDSTSDSSWYSRPVLLAILAAGAFFVATLLAFVFTGEPQPVVSTIIVNGGGNSTEISTDF